MNQIHKINEKIKQTKKNINLSIQLLELVKELHKLEVGYTIQIAKLDMILSLLETYKTSKRF